MAEKRNANPSSLGTSPHLGEVLEFMQLLWAVVHEMQSISKRMHAQLGVTGPQRLVIRILGRLPGLTAGQLAAVLHLHPSTLTGVLARLEEKQILERRPDPVDGRRAILFLTAAGRRFDALRAGTVEHGVQRALARLGHSHTATTRRTLRILLEELERTS
jgi:DNA-binding MarR family transcriptional regulator